MNHDYNTYRTIRKLISYFKAQEIEPSAGEIDRMWNAVSQQIKEDDRAVRRRRSLWIIASVSAAAILLLVFGLNTADRLNGEKDIADVALELATAEVAGDEIQLIMSPQKVLSLKKATSVTYAPDGSVVVDEEKVSEEQNAEDAEHLQYNQIIVPRGKHTQLQLADGSVLYINSGTKVVYPRTFSGKRREIFADGEIYIDVRRDETAPFIVKTARFEVEVLGTAFNVNAYSEDPVSEVVLLRGSVKIKDSSKKTMMLSPNELATVDQGAIGTKQNVVASNYIAWTRGLLILNAESLGNVFQKLERYFDTTISFDSAVKELPMYGSLDLNYPLPEILRRISVTAPIRYEAAGNGFRIEKRE